MKTPFDVVRGKIIDVKPDGRVLIEAQYDDWRTLVRRQYKNCYVEMIDSRPHSASQHGMCWSLIGAIAAWQGQSRSETAKDMINHARKVDFLINEMGENATRLFSMSNAPMSLVAAYQRYLVRFVVEHGIPTSRSMLEYVDDVADYVYACMIHKKCVICGRLAQLHHIDRVGMGRDRTDIIHEGMEALPLCGEHHSEAHTMPDSDFFDRYHLDGGIKLDRTLCKIWKVRNNAE